MRPPVALVAAAESVANYVLQHDAEVETRFAELQGRVIAIHVTGLEVFLYIEPAADGIVFHDVFDGEPDVIIKGTPAALVKLGFSEDARELLLTDEIEILGDVGLGQKFNILINALDLEWEDLLVDKIGVLPAQYLGGLLRVANDWCIRNSESLQATVSEYMQEEIKCLPTRIEVENFMSEVDLLRLSVDRLDAKINAFVNNKQDKQ